MNILIFFSIYFSSTEEFYELIIEIINDDLVREFQSVVHNTIEDSKKLVYCDLKSQVAKVRGYLSVWVPQILCYEKGIKCLGDEMGHISAALEKHLLRSLGLSLADFILRECAFREILLEKDYSIDSDKNRNILIEKFDSSLKNDFKVLYDTLKSSSASIKIFLELFESLVFWQFGFNLPKIDKRSEKEIILANRANLKNLVMTQTHKPALFLTIISLIFNFENNATLLIPGKCVGKVFCMLTKKLNNPEIDLLCKSEVIAINMLNNSNECNCKDDEAYNEVYSQLKTTIIQKYFD